MQSRVVRTRHDTRSLLSHKIPLPWSHWAQPWLVDRGNVGRLPLARAIYRLDPPLKGWLELGWPSVRRPGPDMVTSGQWGEWPANDKTGERKGLTRLVIVFCILYLIPSSCVYCLLSNMLHCSDSKWGSRILSEWATFLITIQTREKSHGFRFQTGFNGFTYRSLNKIGKIIKWIGNSFTYSIVLISHWYF